MHARGSSSYSYPEYGYGSTLMAYSNYPTPTNHSYGDYQPSTAQHNHPPYYPSNQTAASGPYGSDQQHSQQYENSYQSGYSSGQQLPAMNPRSYGHGEPLPPVTNPYGASNSIYAPYPDRGQSYQQPPPPTITQTQSAPPPPPPPPPPAVKPTTYPAPNSLNLKTTKNPYGQTGPYGIDASNPYVDYYRKLYYPYDPITGEYMKDATPPGDTATTNLLSNVMPDVGANMMQRSHAHSSGRYLGSGMDASNMMSNYYGPYDNENDSLLLCCDFLIPRPNIKCLLITLFVLLVLIILIAVIRFLVSSGGDQSEELATLLEQTCMLLLIGAFLDLVWIIGVYFTSRRTRHQIANILSCATNPTMVETTLVPDYNGYLYSNSAAHQHHHAHHHSGRVSRSYGGSGGGGNSSVGGPSLMGNYRYANNYV